jgi:hypothetical protein
MMAALLSTSFEPAARQAHDLIQRDWFLEKVRGARHNAELLFSRPMSFALVKGSNRDIDR